MSGIRNNLFPKNNRIAALILLCVYAYMCGTHIAEAEGTEINLVEYVLCCLTDHYYLMYALLFYLIIDAAIRVKSTSQNAKIRYRTLRRYYAEIVITRLASMLILTVIHLLVPFIVGFQRFGWSYEYNIPYAGNQFYSNYEVIYSLSEIIPNSVIAMVLVTFYLYTGISFICTIFALVFEIAGQKGFVVSVGTIILSSFVGFVTDLDKGIFKYLFMNDYFIFHHGIINGNLWCLTVYVFIMALVTCALFYTAIRRNSNPIRNHNKYTRNLYFRPLIIGIFYIVYCGLALVLSVNGSEVFTWQLLKGFSYFQFNVVEFFYYIAPIMFSLFFVNMEWENEIKEQNLLALIRYGKRDKWEKEKTASEIRFIVVNILIFVVISFLSIAVSASNIARTLQELSSFYSLSIKRILSCGILSILFRCIEWFLFYTLDRTAFKLSKNTIISYLASLAFVFSGFLFPTLNPIGKGSLYQLLEIGSRSIFSFVFLIVLEVSVLLILININKHIKEKGFHGISN
ncbi:MAG: hypothetical protein MJ098_00670 [Saccharofermentans sp.]|nr:hypothetical protein [Saccharofermentans sp.]